MADSEMNAFDEARRRDQEQEDADLTEEIARAQQQANDAAAKAQPGEGAATANE